MSSGVEFEEDSFSRSYGQATPGQSFSPSLASMGYADPNLPKGMAGWLMKRGIVKSPQGAQMMLIGIIIFNCIVTAVFLTILLK